MATKPTDIIARIDELLLDPAQRHVEPKPGQMGFTRAFRQANSINQAERTIQFTASDATVDRYGEVVEVSAFKASLGAFMQNPVFPFGHSYDAAGGTLPTLGHWRSMEVTDKALVGTAWFKPRDLGEGAFRDYVEGNLNSVSVGFITRAYEMRSLKVNGREQLVRVFTDVDLLEVSAVLLPANPAARIRAAGYAATASGGEAGVADAGFIRQLESLVERLEKLSAGQAGHHPAHDDDVADALRGRKGSRADSYFGDIGGGGGDGGGGGGVDDEPEPRQAEQGNDELKHALRDVLTARGEPT
ncbi:MAG: HK97 family phage prohead protease [Phycisphaeraceae bacterium]